MRTPSLQAGAWQTPPTHTPETQSLPDPQALPSVHRGQPSLPPQSTSLSDAFFFASTQLAGKVGSVFAAPVSLATPASCASSLGNWTTCPHPATPSAATNSVEPKIFAKDIISDRRRCDRWRS